MGTKKSAKGGARGTLFKDLAKMRLEDAFILLKEKRTHGALYLAGYAVECALKWAITHRQEEVYLPQQFEIHNLDRLLHASGLSHPLQEDAVISPLFSALVDEWGPEQRYNAGRLDSKKATRLYKQIEQVYLWIIERSI